MASGLTTQQAFTQVQSDITYLADIPKSSIIVNSTTAASSQATGNVTQPITSSKADPTGAITLSSNTITLPAGIYAYNTDITLGTPGNFINYAVAIGLTVNSAAMSVTGTSGSSFVLLWAGGGTDVIGGTDYTYLNASYPTPWAATGTIIGPATIDMTVDNTTLTSMASSTNWNLNITRIA